MATGEAADHTDEIAVAGTLFEQISGDLFEGTLLYPSLRVRVTPGPGLLPSEGAQLFAHLRSCQGSLQSSPTSFHADRQIPPVMRRRHADKPWASCGASSASAAAGLRPPRRSAVCPGATERGGPSST